MSSSRQKIAVVGSGASALGVISGLLDLGIDAEIIIFDYGNDENLDPPENLPPDQAENFYDKIYKKIRENHPFKFPPPKTHFGNQIPRISVEGKIKIYKSNSFGGLTNYWGATMLPFTEREMQKWPISADDLLKHYQAISDLVGISGRPDMIDEYFLHSFVNRPQIKNLSIFEGLLGTVNSSDIQGKFRIRAGLNRCAVETRQGKENFCPYSGDSLAGCFRKSIFSPRFIFDKLIRQGKVKLIKSQVRKILPDSRKIEIIIKDGARLTTEKFDKIFLCAGCTSSTEIVLRSFGISKSLIMLDNAVYNFPIFYFGRKQALTDNAYFGLSNLLLSCMPKNNNGYFAQIQIYPNSDYLWRYNTPLKLWPFVKSIIRASRSRIVWARLYVHSDISQAYSLALVNDQLKITVAKVANRGDYIKSVISDIRKAVNKNGFYFPQFPPILEKSNSHYAGTLPFGNKVLPVASSGEIAAGIYLSDSSIFPEQPAVSPTFTIMANARRIAQEAIT